MSVDTMIQQAMQNVPSAVAAGIVDMSSGMMMGLKTLDSHPQEVIDLLAPTAKEYFQGKLVNQIESIFKQVRGDSSTDSYFQEIMIASKNLWHYFGRLDSDQQVVLSVVCRSDANLGMVVATARKIKTAGSI